MKLSEWIKANNIPNNRILKVLEYYESIDPISFNDPEDVKAEVEEHGLRWVKKKTEFVKKNLRNMAGDLKNEMIKVKKERKLQL